MRFFWSSAAVSVCPSHPFTLCFQVCIFLFFDCSLSWHDTFPLAPWHKNSYSRQFEIQYSYVNLQFKLDQTRVLVRVVNSKPCRSEIALRKIKRVRYVFFSSLTTSTNGKLRSPNHHLTVGWLLTARSNCQILMLPPVQRVQREIERLHQETRWRYLGHVKWNTGVFSIPFGGGIKTDRKKDRWQLAEFLFQFVFFLWDLLVDIKSLILSKGPKIQKVVKSKTTLVFRLRWKDGFHVPSTHWEIHFFGMVRTPPLNHLLCFFASCWRCSDVLLLDLCESFLILIRNYCISK